MTPVIANLDFVKERNSSTVFKAIVEHSSISRIQIARLCNLSAGSVTRITRQLIEAELIREQEQQSSERGRKATSLSPCYEKIQILAARAGRSHLHLGLCDLSGRLLASQSTQIQLTDQNAFTEQLLDFIESFLKAQKKSINWLIGVGITTPGLVNSAKGIISYMPHLRVKNLPLAQQVSDALGLPCYINNSISSMALAEYHFGATKGCNNSLMVSVHNGVGAGMILDGKLYEGNSLAVGEIGHIQINPIGERCYCGNFGCLETLVNNGAIEKRCQQLLSSGMNSSLNQTSDINDICHAANQGDFLATEVLKEAAGNLGKAIAMSVNLLRPEKVVLAGEITQAADIIHPVITNVLTSQTVNINSELETQVVFSELLNSRWYAGFALVRRALLDQGLLMQLLSSSEQE